MDKEDIIRMAQEAGLHLATDVKWMPIIGLEYAEKFAAIAYAAGAAAEREACASLCKGLADWHSEVVRAVYENAADAIRARGQ